jgi:hypothetical protein
VSPVKVAQSDLKAEVERSKALGSSKTAPSAPSQTRAPAGIVGENVKNTEVLRLYEDATNLLITNVLYQRGNFFDYEDCILTCIYTYINENESSEVKKGKSASPLSNHHASRLTRCSSDRSRLHAPAVLRRARREHHVGHLAFPAVPICALHPA